MASILEDSPEAIDVIDPPALIPRKIRISPPALPRKTTIIPFRAFQAGKPAAITTGIFQIR